MSGRNPFAKFSLKPSSLSQHTVNFNKILEEVPSPKIDSIILEKPKFGYVKTDEIVAEAIPKYQEETKDDEKEVQAAPTSVPSFVFGEQLTERVINAETTESSGKENENDTNKEGSEVSVKVQEVVKTTSLFADVDTEKYNMHDNDADVLIRMNCKLFVLDKDAKDQAIWTERGYGILKMIDTNDGLNSKIMMWTDKCFRLVLNTKLFETMDIEKVNIKSIRLNAQDEGTVKNFLIKCGHPNEREDLGNVLINRLKVYKNKVSQNSESKSISASVPAEKEILFECECFLESITNNTDYLKSIQARLYLHKLASHLNKQQMILVDIDESGNEDNVKIIKNQFLKSIKLDKSKLNYSQDEVKALEKIEFEIKESFSLSHKVTIKDSEKAKEFLKHFEQEQQLLANISNDNSTNDSLNNGTSSEEDEVEGNETETASVTKEETDTDEAKPTNENTESKESASKKRKQGEDDETEVSQNENVKKMSLNEVATDSLKRSACDSSQEEASSQETNEKKKTKVAEEDEEK